MKKTAVVTGASSGMGREFVRQIAGKYPWLEEIWAIARRAEELEKLKEEVREVSIRPLSLDISREKDREKLKELLRGRKAGDPVSGKRRGHGSTEKICLYLSF